MFRIARLRALTNLRNRYLLLGDLLLLPLAAYLSFALRLDGLSLGVYAPTCLVFAVLVLVVGPVVLWAAGVYGRYWRYASVEEMLLLGGAMLVIAAVTSAVGFLVFPYFPGILALPRSTPFTFFLLGLSAVALPRYMMRLTARSSYRDHVEGLGLGPDEPQPVLIMGAGDAGAMIVRELKSNPQLGLEPVGFLDDDLGKHDVRIHGVPVLGDRSAIHNIVRRYNVAQVIIAMPTAPGRTIREIVDICEEVGVRTRIIPGIYELLGGQVSVNQLRPVQIEDLLRREPVKTDTRQVAALVHGRRVLVTGAGGSIGSELCRQISRYGPAEVVLLGHGENSVFDICNELTWRVERRRGRNGEGQQAGGVTYHPVIADVRDGDRIQAVFARHRPEIVFHAAAHKHVPLMESNVEDAITNNVLGTRCLVEASLTAEVSHFVFISTDKAVNPTSVMGASKRVAELIVQQAAETSRRRYVAVRFGNVLGSRGSVVPFFQKQIAAGGPVTVTHPDVRRYFMTVPEAVQLVLQAAAFGRGGEVFILDMGDPVRIVDLANDLIRLSGLEPGQDIEVVYTGLRPGEKLFEELFADQEAYTRTHHEKIFVCRNGAKGTVPAGRDLTAGVEELLSAARRGDTAEARRLLAALVPGFPESPDPLAAEIAGDLSES